MHPQTNSPNTDIPATDCASLIGASLDLAIAQSASTRTAELLDSLIYLLPSRVSSQHVVRRIPSTKTELSTAVVRVDERLWPWIVAAVPSPLAYTWLRLHFKRALKAAGAPSDLRLHDLRHCYAQWLVDAGASEARVQVGMRHATAAMTRRYAM